MVITPVILAAGHGTRMKSTLPKVLHPLAGKPLIHYCIEAVQQDDFEKAIVVVGHGAEMVRQTLGERVRFVEQEQQLGTGHAVMVTEPLLAEKTDLIVVTTGDMPLLLPETVRKLVTMQMENKGPISMVTLISENPRGFGRVLRMSNGAVGSIVEEAQATPEQLKIKELNASIYCFKADWLFEALRRVPLSPKGEYYLTDVIGIAVAEGLSVLTLVLEDNNEALGINTRVHLAEAEAILRRRINQRHLLAGVSLIDPEHTYIESDVQIGQDTVIFPDTNLRGKTIIGMHCEIGPNTWIADSRVGDSCKIQFSVLEQAVVKNNVSIGPYAHLREGTHLAEGVHVGNFGEVKNSSVGSGSQMGHFSYIGDAQIGENVNIGAGTITCNFDGEHKNKTEIGDHAFIGSDTMLVAPVKIGKGARTGAGAVVTKDVPEEDTVVGVPARSLGKLKKVE